MTGPERPTVDTVEAWLAAEGLNWTSPAADIVDVIHARYDGDVYDAETVAEYFVGRYLA